MFAINIYFPFDKYRGGGNQFLKALRKEFIRTRVYEGNSSKANVILFNSHHCLPKIFNLKKKFPNKILIHRIDGLIFLTRGKDKILDRVISMFNNLIADGVVFQSNWCKKQNKKYFTFSTPYEAIIYNAPDNEIFNTIGKGKFNASRKIRLISTSISPNWRKGFEIYRYLDENLDFSKYEMTFVGRSPIEFKNIKWIKPVFSEESAKILKEHDIYIIASQNDPCPNSLIEALSCGLPAVALNDGGHPELVREGGELFNGKEDVIEKIEKVARNYSHYQSKIPQFSIEKIAKDYYNFAQKIYKDVKDNKYKPKQINFSTKINFYKMRFLTLKWIGFSKMRSAKERLWPA